MRHNIQWIAHLEAGRLDLISRPHLSKFRMLNLHQHDFDDEASKSQEEQSNKLVGKVFLLSLSSVFSLETPNKSTPLK